MREIKARFTIKNWDSKQLIESLKSKHQPKIDLLLTDPPFNISKDNNFKTMKGRKGIDFGKWDYDFDQTAWISQIAPIMSDNGSVIIFNAWANLGVIKEALETHGFIVKDCGAWLKSNPMPRNMNRRYITNYEFFIWAVKKGAKWVFNSEPHIPKLDSPRYITPFYSYPLVNHKVRIHPTQKPVKLLQELIHRHSNKGDIVADFFMGSGSTGIAAIKEERNFIGSEIDGEYFQKAFEWINDTWNQEAIQWGYKPNYKSKITF